MVATKPTKGVCATYVNSALRVTLSNKQLQLNQVNAASGFPHSHDNCPLLRQPQLIYILALMQDQDSARFIPIKRLGKAIFLKMVLLQSHVYR